MEALTGYGSDSDEEQVAPVPLTMSRTSVSLAPDVVASRTELQYVDPHSKTMVTNMSYDAMYAPVAGPANPFRPSQLAQKNVLTGFVEEDNTDAHTFETQRRTFLSYGYALDPSTNVTGQRRFIGDVAKADAHDGATIYDRDRVLPERTRKRKDRGDAFNDPLNYQGPWAGYEGERMALDINEGPAQTTEESEAAASASEAGTEGTIVEVEGEAEDAGEGEEGKIHMPGNERTTFHGKAERDYLGRPWTTVPQDLDINLLGTSGNQSCFLPKTLIHTWSGHTKGINAIRFFPKTAHLLLSASMDNRVKIWQVYHERACMRTYIGHTKSVRDICFTNDGTQFLSASYDRHIKQWDTETGKCVTNFSVKGIPYCVKFNPDNDKQHTFIAGCNNKKILQFDCRSRKVVQTYDQHLGAVNSVTFIDNNRRFVSTSDDKTIRIWDWGIPVVIKYVADPSMHSVPTATIHPSGKWWLGQSLDNQILIYSAHDRFKAHKSKVFKGHNVAGFACQIGCSPDGRFISSSDSDGMVHFWDFKTAKLLKKLKCHNQVAIGCEWHPHETSKMATGSWDGTIKFWD